MTLHTRSRVESPANGGQFDIAHKTVRWDAKKTAIIICDMWDRHCCKSATGRVAEMAPRSNDFVAAARKRGVLMVHAPSDCMAAYENQPARRRAQNAPQADLPKFLAIRRQDGIREGKSLADRPVGRRLRSTCRPVSRRPYGVAQNDAIKIADEDAISDSGVEIGNLLRPAGHRERHDAGHACEHVRDRPAVRTAQHGPPGQERGAGPRPDRRDVQPAQGAAGEPRPRHGIDDRIHREVRLPHDRQQRSARRAGLPVPRDRRPHVVLVSYEDEYRSAETLPRFAQELCERFGCYCSFLRGEKATGIFGLEELATADVLVLYVRRHALPKEQMAMIRRYLDAGKPLVALRTASHAFDLRGQACPPGWKRGPPSTPTCWAATTRPDAAGRRTEISVADNAAGHPILAGMQPGQWTSSASLYNVSPVDAGATMLLTGKCEEQRRADRLDPQLPRRPSVLHVAGQRRRLPDAAVPRDAAGCHPLGHQQACAKGALTGGRAVRPANVAWKTKCRSPPTSRVCEVTSGLEPIEFRTPMKFGGRVMTGFVVVNVAVVAETRDGRRSQGFGSMPMANVWAWPSPQRLPPTRPRRR